LSRFSKKFGKRIEGVSQETMELLVSYHWPGNIRELQNIIERGVIISQSPVLALGRDLLPAQDAVDRLAASAGAGRQSSPPAATTRAGTDAAQPSDYPLSLEDVERRHILAVLEKTRGVIEGPNGAARVLNIHPNTLRSRMKKLGIRRPAREIS
ncbi:MAG TPA: helix-turn-helix domain-containing protein, partial [Blastocatellia bacterium]|nr:helix-turn-helix domain-containing protein [Blastocatellia bacterium]